jgi:glycosyltransferase involved in cell wall biosynthesis
VTTIALTLDQLYRDQPGGIGTYVRGLVQGFGDLAVPDLTVVGVAPSGSVPTDVAALDLPLSRTHLGVRLTTRLWGSVAVGVPREASVVHATSMAGPFAGGQPHARHSVTVHDLLWRDVPDATTAEGAAFHEARLATIIRRDTLRVIVTSESLALRLEAEGIDRSRLVVVTLGADDAQAADLVEARRVLHEAGVTGPFTVASGTVEPRKNLARLVAAHHDARSVEPSLGPLVIVGPQGWGETDTGNAVRLGRVSWPVLLGLYQLATVVAYVPLAEGWGFPPVEALRAGTAVVTSTTVPSTENNALARRVDPHRTDAIAEALVAAAREDASEPTREARRASVANLTWRACAESHLRGWR